MGRRKASQVYSLTGLENKIHVVSNRGKEIGVSWLDEMKKWQKTITVLRLVEVEGKKRQYEYCVLCFVFGLVGSHV